jgi:cobalt-zinc-cadmium efflux system outer membrane protein
VTLAESRTGETLQGDADPAKRLQADNATWTLESTIQRVTQAAPEGRAADAEVAMRRGELTQAGAWPNPTIDLRADDRLGQEDGRGGAGFTQLAISQPLPFKRVPRERAAAEARLAGAKEGRRLRQLELERAAAQAFHKLQLALAKLELTRARLKESESYPGAGGARDRLVRYLAPLERARLAVLREEANQAVLAAQREYDKALVEFRSLLALSPDAAVTAAPLEPSAAPPDLAALERALEAHPALAAARREVEAARAGISAAASQRFADPVLNFFRERDFLNGARRDVTGVGVSVQIPLWNANRGPVDKAKAEASRAHANLAALQRDALNRLRQSHTDLARLIEQAIRIRTSLLEPAREVLDLTRRGFAAGENNILALVDAYSVYFDARARYVETLKDAALAAADLRVAAGRSVLSRETAP